MPLGSMIKSQDIDVVSPEGEVRCRIKAKYAGSIFLVTDTSADIRVGDEIRRLLPNGKEEAFVVDDPKFYDASSFGPHYQVAVSRPRTFDRKTGENYSIHVSGHNSRVNIDSNDYSNNTVSSGSLFDEVREAVSQGVGDANARDELIAAVRALEASKDKASFGKSYQAFIASSANHMSIVAPFLPALATMLAKFHS